MSGASLELLLSRHPGPHHLPAAQMTPGFRTISFRGVRTVVPPVHGAPISVLASPGVPAPSAAPRGAEPRFAPVFTESLCSVYTQHRHSPAHQLRGCCLGVDPHPPGHWRSPREGVSGARAVSWPPACGGRAHALHGALGSRPAVHPLDHELLKGRGHIVLIPASHYRCIAFQ